MGKLKPVSGFKEDVREGDLVRIVHNLLGNNPSHESVGYFTLVQERGSGNNKYNGRLVGSYGEGVWPESLKGVNLLLNFGEVSEGILGYEVLRRRKERFPRPHDRTIQD
ncbi:MAG: hypothetical protein WC533_02115 [Candidatus Pacearchaeota archaeon]